MLYTRQIFRSAALTGLVAFVILGVSACGGSSSSGSDNNKADVAFVQHMLPHHMHGVEMATLAVQKGSTPAVRDLGTRIAEQQRKEIGLMQGFLKDYDAKSGPPAPAVKMKADEMQIAKLKSARGAAFDRDFLMFMMGHHLSAIDMAQIEQTSGQAADAKKLAAAIVSKQETEAKEMQRLLVAG